MAGALAPSGPLGENKTVAESENCIHIQLDEALRIRIRKWARVYGMPSQVSISQPLYRRKPTILPLVPLIARGQTRRHSNFAFAAGCRISDVILFLQG
jgi:hypothetical protein